MSSTRCRRRSRDIAYQNKRVIYDLLMKAAAETTLAIAADPKHLGARIGITAVLHTWGSALTHHPHVHMIVPGWRAVARWRAMDRGAAALPRPRQRALAPVPGTVPGDAGRGSRARPPHVLRRPCGTRRQDERSSGSWRRCAGESGWSTARSRSRGLEQVLRYLSRYTHRVAISNRRLVAADDNGVAFRWKDYRIVPEARLRHDGPDRWKTMTLPPHEFIRRFLMHVLPKGFHRIRHYGLFANGNRAANIARARELLGAAPRVVEPEQEKTAAPDEPRVLPCPCPRCGGRMIVIEVFAPRLRAEISADACSDADQDRHVMTAARIAPRKAAPPERRSSAGDDPARLVAPHTWLTASAKQRLHATFRSSSYPPGALRAARPPSNPIPTDARRGQIPIEPAAPSAPH